MIQSAILHETGPDKFPLMIVINYKYKVHGYYKKVFILC